MAEILTGFLQGKHPPFFLEKNEVICHGNAVIVGIWAFPPGYRVMWSPPPSMITGESSFFRRPAESRICKREVSCHEKNLLQRYGHEPKVHIHTMKIVKFFAL